MVQKSGDHQLRLVVEIPLVTTGFIHPSWFSGFLPATVWLTSSNCMVEYHELKSAGTLVGDVWKILRKHQCLVLIETKVKHQISPLKTFFQQAKSVAKTKDSEHWGHPLMLLFGKLMPGRKQSICIDAPFTSPKFHIPPEKTMVWICFCSFLDAYLSGLHVKTLGRCYLFNILKCVCWTGRPGLSCKGSISWRITSFPSSHAHRNGDFRVRGLGLGLCFSFLVSQVQSPCRPIAPMTTWHFNWRFWNTKLYHL